MAGKRSGPDATPGRNLAVPLQKAKRRVAEAADGGRLPASMLCVLDHLAAGLPPGPRSLLILYGRHGHDGGCGIWPGLRALSRELRTSPVTLRDWRNDLQDAHLIERLPRKAPHGTDLLRLGPCEDCQPQRDSMRSRCRDCQRDSLQHAETEWWAAQRDYMQSRKKRRELQGVPAASPVGADHRPPAASPDGDGSQRPPTEDSRTPAPPGSGGRSRPAPRNPPTARRQAAESAFNPTIPGTTAKQPAAGIIIAFKAGSPSPSDRGKPSTLLYAATPSAATRGPSSNPGDARRSSA